ncbi:MAG TPA: NADH-quinone oxidoreductase subunit J [Pseudonocardia sp.]
MSTIGTVLAQAQPGPSSDTVGGAVTLGETIAFWVLGVVSLAGGLGMVFARNAVHSALWLVLCMLCLGALYMVQQAPFLGFAQIIVYTGAVMMLFLFVLMLVGRDSSDSVVEVLRGQRLAAGVFGVGFAGLLFGSLFGSLNAVRPAGLAGPNAGPGGNVGGLGRLVFTKYLFPFELTSALLITAAMGAMLLAYSQASREAKRGQRATVEARLRGEYRGGRIAPLPGPGVFATANSVATPALLPDGSVSKDSLYEIIESVRVEEHEGTHVDAHALTGMQAGKQADPGPEPADASTPNGADASTPNGADASTSNGAAEAEPAEDAERRAETHR